MDRKEFLKVCSGACLALVGMRLLPGCAPTQYITVNPSNNRIVLQKSQFAIQKEDKTVYRKYIIVKPQNSDYPIVVYRNGNQAYTALLMRCTHQGNELSVSGEILTCAAHGSEFSKSGEVLQGPAESSLRNFPVVTEADQLYIQLS